MPVPSQDLDFQCHMSWFFFCVQWWEVVVLFVDIGGIVDHHCLSFLFIITINTYIYTPRKHSFGGYIGIGLSVRLSGPTSTSFVRFPPNFVEFKIMMCELCSIKDFIFHWVMPLWTKKFWDNSVCTLSSQILLHD